MNYRKFFILSNFKPVNLRKRRVNTPLVNNETNDMVFYEFGRFMELLSLNNPNILELLNTPETVIIYKHPF